MHCLSTNVPAKASADVVFAITRQSSLNPIVAGDKKVQPVPPKAGSPQIGLDLFVLLCQDKRTERILFFPYHPPVVGQAQRKEIKESSPLPINYLKKNFAPLNIRQLADCF